MNGVGFQLEHGIHFAIKMFLPEREHVSLFAIRDNISQIFQLRFAA